MTYKIVFNLHGQEYPIAYGDELMGHGCKTKEEMEVYVNRFNSRGPYNNPLKVVPKNWTPNLDVLP